MLNYLKKETNYTYTENGALVHETTGSALVDFFAHGGALRNRDEQEIISMFSKAFAEDPLIALKLLFYFRDIRGGQGERRTFRVIINYLAKHYPDVVKANLKLIPEYGRWDDVYALFDTPLEAEAAELMKEQLMDDLISDHPSLLGKWLKSENASSPNTKRLAKKTREYFEMTPKQYRKILKHLRDKIRIVESYMSHNRWNEIEYDKLPAKARMIYRNAFLRHDEERYREYLESLKKGEKKVKSDTIYPYEIVEKVTPWRHPYTLPSEEEIILLEEMWKNLPDFCEGKEENSIVVADTSGSMSMYSGRPLAIAISLALYAAERLKGPFHNHFITFSRRPKMQEIKGNNIYEKLVNLSAADWDMNTDIEAVFDLILNVAKKYSVPKEEMIQKIYVVSDMEFDAATDGDADKTLFENIKKRYEEAGYDMPMLVFWNVNSRNTHVPMTMDERGVLFVSGASPSIFKNLLKGEIVTAYDLMMDVVNSERYAPIRLP